MGRATTLQIEEAPPDRERDRGAEDFLQHEDAFGVMPERAVPVVGDDLLGFIEPGMKREIVRV
jgi:hypothetical protein